MATEAKIKITAQNDTDSAFRKAEANLKGMQDSAAGLAASLGGAVAAGGLTLLVKNAIDAADNLRDLSQSTGIAIDSLGGLGFAASQNGGSLESVASAAGKLNKSIAEAAAGSKEALQPFQAIGVSVTDAAGKTKAADVVFAELADKFQTFEDGPEKAALALKLFGKAGADQIALLNEGGDALRANIDYYKRFSGVTEEVARQADQFNDTLGKINLIGQSLGTTLAASLLPPLQAVADEFLAAKENGSGFAAIGDIVRVVFEAVAIAAANVQFVLVSMGREIGAIAAQAAALGRLDIKGFNAISTAVKEDGVRARAELDALERRILNIAQPNAGDQTSAESRRLGLSKLTPPKTQAPRLPGAGGAGKEKDPDADFKRYLDNLQKQLEKTRDLSTYEQLLADIAAKRVSLRGDQQQQLADLAKQLDLVKQLAAASEERMKIGRQLAIEEGDAVQRANEIYQDRLKSLLDAAPSEMLKKQLDDISILRDEYEKGRLSEKLYTEAVSARLGLVADKTKETKSLAEELGLSFTSAFEDAIVGGKGLQDVIKGIEQDILRLVTRELVTKPAGDALTSLLKGGSGGGTGPTGTGFGPVMAFIDTIFGGARATGGPVMPGKAYLVGERGPEIIMPQGAGTVLPNGAGGGNVVNITVAQSFAAGTDRRTILQAAADASRQLQLAGRNL